MVGSIEVDDHSSSRQRLPVSGVGAVSTAERAFWLDLSGHLGYTAAAVPWVEVKRSDSRAGKAVGTMCFSPCFVHMTREALVQRQLRQCRTCGAQAFHILDCCCNPDYGRIPASPLGGRLKAWLGAVQARMRAALLLRRQRADEPLSPGTLEAWEAQPLTHCHAEHTPAWWETSANMAGKTEEEVEPETSSAYR
jgi:hypothetical protein